MIKNQLPLVSVGITAFNRPDALANCLQSVLKQTYSNLQIIVSDDFSPDKRVWEVAKKTKYKTKRGTKKIEIYRQKYNIGAANNLEFVLQKSRGKYFFWADDEDLVKNNFVSEIVSFLEKNKNTVLCTSDIILVDEKNKKKATMELTQLRQDKWFHIKPLFFQYPITTVFYAFLGIYRTNVLKKAGTKYLAGYKNFHINDEVLFLANLSNYGEIRSINKKLKTYRVNPESNYHKQMRNISFLDWHLLRFFIRFNLVKIICRSSDTFFQKILLGKEVWQSMVYGFLNLQKHRAEKTFKRFKLSLQKRKLVPSFPE